MPQTAYFRPIRAFSHPVLGVKDRPQPSRAFALLLVLAVLASCKSRKAIVGETAPPESSARTVPMRVGAARFEAYSDWVEGKKLGLVANQASVVDEMHVLDFLIQNGATVERVFSPEHGFRAKAAAGEEVSDDFDRSSGLPIVSLYGVNKRPTAEQLKGIELMVFDLQDVGTRFYTYVSTLSYMLEACAEQGIPVLILDRPNPNGDLIDGPILKPGFESFVGLHPVPVAHGLTLGEYASMALSERWLKNSDRLELKVVRCEGWTHSRPYSLPVQPSPNLPNDQAIRLYPSLCFFEGTDVSIGRGTDYPFQVVGAPWMEPQGFEFKPKKRKEAPSPPHLGETCQGADLRAFSEAYLSIHRSIYWFWLVDAYRQCPHKDRFFNSYFDKLAGTDELRLAIIAGADAEDLARRWKPEIAEFKEKRRRYLLYAD